MGRTRLINALKKFQDAEYNRQNLFDLHGEVDLAMDGQLTFTECKEFAIAFLNLEK